jgi:hypothetical protein
MPQREKPRPNSPSTTDKKSLEDSGGAILPGGKIRDVIATLEATQKNDDHRYPEKKLKVTGPE